MIGIIDTGAKNIGSILNSLNFLKIKNIILNNPKQISEKITHIILPGVGNFESVMKNLKKTGFSNIKLKKLMKQKKILAICVGFQILFSMSDESKIKGINFFNGKISDLKKTKCKGVIPHVGFNSVKVEIKKKLDFLKKKDFYFIHRYFLSDNIDTTDEIVTGITTHGSIKFISLILSKNLIATQFHPEKSGLNGIEIFKYFYGQKKSYI
jgi:glutamine amidotransferase